MASDSRSVVCPRAMITWQPPIGETTKMNFDVAWDQNSLLAVVAAVTRNSNCKVLCYATWSFPNTELGAKCRATFHPCRHQTGFFRGFQFVTIESNSAMANGELAKTCLLGGLVYHIINLSSLLQSCNFMFCRREANALAHSLANVLREMRGIVLR